MAERAVGSSTPLLLSAGFRLFFLLAGLIAVLNGIAWLAWLGVHAAGAMVSRPSIGVAPYLWHGHEMIYGYAMAAVAGFFLTAVPSWTGTPPVKGRLLGWLGAVWLAGRIAMWTSALLPPLVVAVLDLAFVPMLAVVVAVALRAKPAPRNLVVLAVLLFLFAGNAITHLDWRGWSPGLASTGLAGGVLALVTLIGLIGGRIVPAFTRNALERAGKTDRLPVSLKPLEAAAIVPLWLLLFARLAQAPDVVLAVLAAWGALANAARLALWRGLATLDSPILWSLHLGFAWVPLGLAALAVAYGTGALSEATALHGLAIGAVAGMTLAVMTRAALGHSGRPLVVARPIALAYALIALSALLRVLGPALAPGAYMTWVLASGTAWTLAYILYVWVYWPILTGPEVR